MQKQKSESHAETTLCLEA